MLDLSFPESLDFVKEDLLETNLQSLHTSIDELKSRFKSFNLLFITPYITIPLTKKKSASGNLQITRDNMYIVKISKMIDTDHQSIESLKSIINEIIIYCFLKNFFFDITNNIISYIHAYTIYNDQIAFYLEHIPGTLDLKNFFEKSENHNEYLYLYIIKQLINKLKILHNIGIYLLDIKPENIIIEPNLNIKFIDFGYSQICLDSLHPNYHLYKMTRSLSINMTTIYSSPQSFTKFIKQHFQKSEEDINKLLEPYLNDKNFLKKIDIYSLGLTIVYCLFKIRVFTPTQLTQQVSSKDLNIFIANLQLQIQNSSILNEYKNLIKNIIFKLLGIPKHLYTLDRTYQFEQTLPSDQHLMTRIQTISSIDIQF
jgi:serine/threonine protein kinase